MKHFQLQYLLILCSLLFGNPKLSAALTTSGTWSTTTISADETVNLTGDITLKGKITIEAGKTLTINGNDEARLIQYTGNDYMFEVKGTLIIKGTEGAVITLDAGGNLQWNAEKFDLDVPKSRKKIGAAIRNYGKIDLQYVTIRNVDDTDGETGGAIFVETNCSGQTLLDNCIIENCRSCLGSAIGVQNQESKTDSEAIAIKISNSIIRHCISGGGTVKKAGGAIRTYGKTTSSLYLTNVIFEENRSKRANESISEDDGNRDANGGALFWNAHNTPSTKCYIDGCVFRNNRSDDNGGAIKSQASIEFLNNTTYIEGNQAPIGGGLYIEGYIGGADTGEHSDIVYELNQYLVVRNNIATNGGNDGDYEKGGKGAGIHFAFLSTMDLYKGSTITINVNGAQIMNNRAETGLGGGIYLQNTTIEEKKYKITINLNHGIVQENSAKQGGGMYIKGTTVKSAPNENAMFINNNTSTEGGGGLMLDGGNLTMEHGIISNNTSNNGGGICLIHGASMTFKNGLITSNKAVATNSVSFTTAFEKPMKEVEGIGGGVYLSAGVNGGDRNILTFDITGNIGIYENLADKGADDIYVNGYRTIITLPDVSSMNLSNYQGASDLHWVEDYTTGDTEYSSGTYINKTSGYQAVRYRDAQEGNGFTVPDSTYIDQYICLALGYQNIFATIKKTGLKEGESAIFNVYRKVDDEYTPWSTVLLTGKKDVSEVSKEIIILSGDWKVVENNWSWGYDLTTPNNNERSIVIENITSDTEAADKTFHFTNTPKKIDPVKYDEDIKVNIMKL